MTFLLRAILNGKGNLPGMKKIKPVTTIEGLARLINNEVVEKMAMKEDTATKEDLKKMTTKDDLNAMEKRLDERLIGIENRLDALENKVSVLHDRILDAHERRIAALESKIR